MNLKIRAVTFCLSLLLAFSSISCAANEKVANDTEHLLELEAKNNLSNDKDFLQLVSNLNSNLSLGEIKNIAETIENYSKKYEVPISLIVSVIAAESEFHPSCKGTLDDTGLMQIRQKYAPYWAAQMNIKAPQTREKLFEIDTNIHIGTYILKRLLKRYDGNMERVLVAYNAGETYVDKKLQEALALPKHYVKRVSRFHMELCNTPVSALEY